MIKTNYITDLEFTYEIFKLMKDDELSYFYRGGFSQIITENLISLTQTNLEQTNEPTKIKKKVYFIMVESLQNIIKHQDESVSDLSQTGIFLIQKRGAQYYITSGNLIESVNIGALRSKLEKINSLDGPELKTYYLQMLRDGEISDKGGAGLGLIEIAKKSGNKLAFEFRNINSQQAFFYLQTNIQSVASEEEQTPDKENGFTISGIKSIHELLNKERVKLIFRGSINQETLISLLSVIKAQLTEKMFKKRTISLIIELLQNIVKHGYNAFDTNEENSGIFIISKKENGYHLYTGNYVEKSKIKVLKTRIEVVNDLKKQELESIYNRGLFEQEHKFKSNAGLGLVKLKIKSKEPFRFNFYDVTDDVSFFTFQVVV